MSASSMHVLASDPAFRRLKDHVILATGLWYYADKDDDLAAHVARRLAARGLADCAAYLSLLLNGPGAEAELDAIIEDLTIGETFFFRHREMFDALRDVVLPERIERNREGRHLRIWSAGCAVGAEAYSIAMLLRRELASQLAGWDVTIVGTDINRGFLARAREGRFESWALRGLPEDVKRACFTPSGNSWLLAPEYKNGVNFQYHNLVTHPFPSLVNNLFAFDLILCRNVTIYFSLDIVRRIIGQFHQSLLEGGWLLVGHSEPNLELFRDFQTVNVPGAVLYQKSAAPPVAATWPFAAVPAPPSTPTFVAPPPVWLPYAFPEQPADLPLAEAKHVPLVAAKPAGPDVGAIRALADRGEWEQALACCEESLQQANLHPLLYFYQALILEQLGRHAETEQALRRVLYLDRQFVLAHYYLGLLLQKTGRTSQAARSFANVLQLLAHCAPELVFDHADGITAAELDKLTRMHLEILEGA